MKKTVAVFLLLAITSPASAQLRREGGQGAFDAADVNHDGIVTRSEFQSYRQKMFDRLDRNGDRVVSPADFPRLAGARPELYRRLTEALDGADLNNDGAVSRDELAQSPMRMFDRADANRDGQVTAAEAQAIRDRIRDLRQSRSDRR